MKRWSDDELEFLTKYYLSEGARYCASRLNRPETYIYKQARKLGLRRYRVPSQRITLQDATIEELRAELHAREARMHEGQQG